MRVILLVGLFVGSGVFAANEDSKKMVNSWKKMPMEKKVRLHKAMIQVVADNEKSYPQEAEKNVGSSSRHQDVLSILEATRQVSAKNMRTTVSSLSRASRSLAGKWDVKLARESLRVMSLVMKVRPNYQFNADLFVEVLNSNKKDKFLKEAQNILSKKDYKIFSENVEIVLNSSGNG